MGDMDGHRDGSRTVGEVAELVGVTVRTLHHYDEIGLLRPSGRTHAGYRLYDPADLLRLQQILVYRGLGFPLDEIVVLLDDPAADEAAHLRRQHQLLTERIVRLQDMAAAVELALEAQRMDIDLTPEERFEVFGDFDPDEHAEEVEQRWGSTDAYRESARRTASYTKADWQRMKDEGAAVVAGLVAAMGSGEPADGTVAMDLAEEHRQQICRWFYDCPPQVHVGLGEMYVVDPRFTATYEAARTGLATYLRDAIAANAARAGGPRG